MSLLHGEQGSQSQDRRTRSRRVQLREGMSSEALDVTREWRTAINCGGNKRQSMNANCHNTTGPHHSPCRPWGFNSAQSVRCQPSHTAIIVPCIDFLLVFVCGSCHKGLAIQPAWLCARSGRAVPGPSLPSLLSPRRSNDLMWIWCETLRSFLADADQLGGKSLF